MNEESKPDDVKPPQIVIVALTERDLGAWEQWARDRTQANQHPVVRRIFDLAIIGLRTEIAQVKKESSMNDCGGDK